MDSTGLPDKPFLVNLPIEILQQILQFCDIIDMCRIAQTCTRLNQIINDELERLHIKHKKWVPLITNQLSDEIQARSFKIINSALEKYRISHNWLIGKYKESVQLKTKLALMPWLHLDREFLWVGRRDSISRYKRDSKLFNNNWQCKSVYVIRNRSIDLPGRNTDTSRFAVNDTMIVTGSGMGSIFAWDINLPNDNPFTGVTNTEIHTVDIGPSTISCGSKERVLSLFPIPDLRSNNKTLDEIGTFTFEDRIWSLKYNKSGSLAIGTSGITGCPLAVLDLETECVKTYKSQYSRCGAGILDLHWMDENCLYTCGYDSYVYLWDLRIKIPIAKWMEPDNSGLCCLQTDGLYSILCGTQQFGKVTLWDKRQRKALQRYYFSLSNRSSPVFSLAFDATTLYGALDRSINALDFQETKNPIRNYSAFT